MGDAWFLETLSWDCISSKKLVKTVGNVSIESSKFNSSIFVIKLEYSSTVFLFFVLRASCSFAAVSAACFFCSSLGSSGLDNFTLNTLSTKPSFHFEKAVASSPTAWPLAWAPIETIVDKSLVTSVLIPKEVTKEPETGA